MCTLKLGEITSTLEIFPGTSTLENEIQKYVPIRDFGLYRHFQVRFKSFWTWKAGKVLSLVFELLHTIAIARCEFIACVKRQLS